MFFNIKYSFNKASFSLFAFLLSKSPSALSSTKYTKTERRVKGLNGETINYGYDFNSGNLISVTSSSEGISNNVSLGYNQGFVTSLKSNGIKVNYEYDGQGRVTRIVLNDNDERKLIEEYKISRK